MAGRNANLVIRSFNGGEELEVGKVVWFDDKWIVHCWIYQKYQRHSQGAWGVRAPVLRFMVKYSLDTLYFWDNKKQITYQTSLQQLRDYATLGKPDKFGGTMNLPVEYWVTLDKLNVAWVPKEERAILQATELPWDMPTPTGSRSKTSKSKPGPAGVTLALPFI